MAEFNTTILVDYLTPKLPQFSQSIPRNEYAVRKEILINKKTKILNILRTGYWDQLESAFKTLSINKPPIYNINKIRNLTNGADDMLYLHLIDLHIVLQYLNMIEDNVASDIDYDEIVY